MNDNVMTDDQAAIREMFGFTKSKPIVYKARSRDGIKAIPVISMQLVHLDEDKTIGSLIIALDNSEQHRICSSYLKEMQSSSFTFESKSAEDND